MSFALKPWIPGLVFGLLGIGALSFAIAEISAQAMASRGAGAPVSAGSAFHRATPPIVLAAASTGAREKISPPPPRFTARLGPGYWIQLAAHHSIVSGENAWNALMGKHRRLLAGEPHAIIGVDLGKRGRYYRVLVGPYAARGPTIAKCAQLKRAKVACFVITRHGRLRQARETLQAKPPATSIPSAAIKPVNPAAPRNAGIKPLPAFVRSTPNWLRRLAKQKSPAPALGRMNKRAADIPFQRHNLIPGSAK